MQCFRHLVDHFIVHRPANRGSDGTPRPPAAAARCRRGLDVPQERFEPARRPRQEESSMSNCGIPHKTQTRMQEQIRVWLVWNMAFKFPHSGTFLDSYRERA